MFYDMEGKQMSVSRNLNRESETQHHKQIHDFQKVNLFLVVIAIIEGNLILP